jgi:dTDP-L-rhamnose 4-epimerase
LISTWQELDMTERILITGGAGFIGLAVARHLLSVGESVTILDNFHPQIHDGSHDLPQDIAGAVHLIRGDVSDKDVWLKALAGQSAVLHLAAETGTGQSMYAVERYSRTNLTGTALLLDLLANRQAAVERLVIASSRAIYGEGAYHCEQDGLVYPQPRSAGEKQSGEFEPICPVCRGFCMAAATPESAPAQPASFYGLTKLTQEQMVLLFGRVLGIPSVALRYQNVFGPGQSLQNPYTGILAIFSNLARAGEPIRVFEDGMESRDFVYIDDVVAATVKALLAPIEGCHSVNVGSGERTTVLQVAEQVNAHSGGHSTVQVTGAFREGDIRHGFADLAYAQRLLGYRPAWSFHDGLERFLSWAEHSSSSTEGYEHSLAEMRHRGLLRD